MVPLFGIKSTDFKVKSRALRPTAPTTIEPMLYEVNRMAGTRLLRYHNGNEGGGRFSQPFHSHFTGM
jgi:hypothetical protein